ncbi:MAG: sugar phosphate isomerase/epimerase family protein [Candidatus Sulfotelmatobacter sp.]
MNISFSTLACPDWSMPQIIQLAADASYDGIELRFVEGEDSLWKLPAFSGTQMAETRRALTDHGLTIACVDTSCRFHSPDARERDVAIEEAERMSDITAELGAPGIRVFGDTIQPGADRDSTRKWIAESIRNLADRTAPKGVQVWIETHGDFVAAGETAAILRQCSSPCIGVVWDPVNSLVATGEPLAEGARLLGSAIRHIHVKDFRHGAEGVQYVLAGEGIFPWNDLSAALKQLPYNSFLSFEWEKKWHPELEDASIAVPHFAKQFAKAYVDG